MKLPSVKISEITKKRDYELAEFATDTIAAIKNNHRYDGIATLFAGYETRGNSYVTAYTASRSGADVDVQLKKIEKVSFLNATRLFARALEANCNGDASYITDALFPLKEETPRPLPISYIDAPFDLTLTPRSEGVLELKFKLRVKKDVHMTNVEYSLDQGKTWILGTSKKAVKIILSGLPSRSEAYVRAQNMDRRGLKSAWSQFVSATVL